ncbi:hypothetical protein GCM10022288_00290 [Gryllotalpicola kribbensis]|uniref:DUF222 domain-containing protein n=1 Tax=Gryllotalpicola kribbensis TaxID=993084 RepID=A0ABP8AEG6_9MICO
MEAAARERVDGRSRDEWAAALGGGEDRTGHVSDYTLTALERHISPRLGARHTAEGAPAPIDGPKVRKGFAVAIEPRSVVR